MPDAQIVQLFPTRATASSEIRSEQEQRVGVPTSVVEEIIHSAGRTLTVDELYPDLDTNQSILGSALILLAEAETKLLDGETLARVGDQISSDDATQHFLALLPELFCCRSLGDSFATVINALFHELKNLNGVPVEEAQITQMLNAIRVLRRRPFLEYNEALDVVARLEATGLRVAPRGLAIIAEALLA